MVFRLRRIRATDPLASQADELIARCLPGARTIAESAGDDAMNLLAVRPHPAGERVIGVVRLHAVDDNGGSGRVIGPVVDPQLQHQGVGRRLLAEAEREAFGVRSLRRLRCEAPAASAAFLEELGWRRDETGSQPLAAGRVELLLEIEPHAGPGASG